ncbi:hypothetical protein OK016_16890 [Vibrio chagasii]|nr:hypothetical protein [Vibrio chagasii]
MFCSRLLSQKHRLRIARNPGSKTLSWSLRGNLTSYRGVNRRDAFSFLQVPSEVEKVSPLKTTELILSILKTLEPR